MNRLQNTILKLGIAISLFAATALAGCAGPSTRVLPRQVSNTLPQEMPEEAQVLEEGNPFYLQEALDYLTSLDKWVGGRDEREAVAYIERMLKDYGYDTRLQPVALTEGNTATNVIGIRRAQAPDADIIMIVSGHNPTVDSPGANERAAGVVTLLECARLLSKLSTDTEIHFISAGGEEAGERTYIDSMSARERQRVVGAICLENLGFIRDDSVFLGTIDEGHTLLGNSLQSKVGTVGNRPWSYKVGVAEGCGPFSIGQIPAVVVSQGLEAYEAGTPYDRAKLVDVEQLMTVVSVVSQTVADFMDTDTPSQLAKSRFISSLQEQTYTRRRYESFYFGTDYEDNTKRLGMLGAFVSSYVDGTEKQINTYRYRMNWFDVEQIIYTDYHYSDGTLQTISLDADGAGITFDEMKARISSWYGEPIGENSGPNGTEYDWIDSVYGGFFALIPKSNGYTVEIHPHEVPRTAIASYGTDGRKIEEGVPDSRTELLATWAQGMIAPKDYERFSSIYIYTDGYANTTGYLDPPDRPEGEDMPPRGIYLDLEDALDEEGVWRNQTETVKLLLVLYGQLFQEEYGSENPEFARDFMWFVLCEKPEEVPGVWNERLLYFYESDELLETRIWIRNYLQLEQEM